MYDDPLFPDFGHYKTNEKQIARDERCFAQTYRCVRRAELSWNTHIANMRRWGQTAFNEARIRYQQEGHQLYLPQGIEALVNLASGAENVINGIRTFMDDWNEVREDFRYLIAYLAMILT